MHRIKNERGRYGNGSARPEGSGPGGAWEPGGGSGTRARKGKANQIYQVRTPWETAGRKAIGPQRDACDAPAASCQVGLSHSKPVERRGTQSRGAGNRPHRRLKPMRYSIPKIEAQRSGFDLKRGSSGVQRAFAHSAEATARRRLCPSGCRRYFICFARQGKPCTRKAKGTYRGLRKTPAQSARPPGIFASAKL